jgi:predicted transposase YbfD/YdcC
MEKLQQYLSEVPDFRLNRKKLYPLEEILFLVINACVCGTYEFEEIQDYGESRLSYLRGYYPYANGVPSHDTINRVLSMLDAAQFQLAFMRWVRDILGEKTPEIIPIDGKALRGTAPRIKNSKKLMHHVSAWAHSSAMTLAQVNIEGKGHEIQGITDLLALLDIKGDTVTIDAIGCQTAICEQIIDKGGHYVIAVKENQKELYDEIENAFKQIAVQDVHTQTDADNGMVNQRTCHVIHHLETFIPEASRFKHATSVICILSKRFNKQTQTETIEQRYYISDLDYTAQTFNGVVRAHWGIENKQHWHLDVTMNEDGDRKRTKNLSTNFGLIRKIALNILAKAKTTENIAIKRIQKKALMSDKYLKNLFF